MSKRDMVKYIALFHLTMILLSFILFSLGTVAWGILGTLLTLGCCVMTFFEGRRRGEEACSLQNSIEHADAAHPVDEKTRRQAYNPANIRKGILVCAVVPLIISLIYLGVYGAALKTQGYIFGAEDAEAAMIEEETLPEATVAPEATIAPEATVAPEAADGGEADDQSAEGDEAAAGGSLADWVATMTTLDKATLIMRLVTWVLALPYWAILSFWRASYVTLDIPAVILLLLYGFVWPACMYAGYLQGPRMWKRTEEAMKQGKRRAKARSRIGKKVKPRQAPKPMI